MNGAQLIVEERQRQQAAEGYTGDHDDQHDLGQLAGAAAVYACPLFRDAIRQLLWPGEWWSYSPASDASITARRRELVKAGALIAAEIDRLDRLEEATR